ncbi:uncharacterized protein LOC127131625 [Lathyrus oleraceus]|uniref:uncharacterized protein LOC127131625 n=1 Tax=Pisum sativum TaxID=3888 RepID=UPI0021CE4C0B|nr:uncharacterized protein LOC127131625 [Pisum sativum]
MAYAYAQKILYGAHMLSEEEKYWWDNARPRFEANGTMITWAVFKRELLEKYFPADVCGRKEVEFLELKQANMIVANYTAKFEQLSKFCPHYNGIEVEMSKCIKFENVMRPEIKQFIGYREIRRFSVLVNKCRIYNEDIRAKFSHYNNVSDKRMVT